MKKLMLWKDKANQAAFRVEEGMVLSTGNSSFSTGRFSSDAIPVCAVRGDVLKANKSNSFT